MKKSILKYLAPFLLLIILAGGYYFWQQKKSSHNVQTAQNSFIDNKDIQLTPEEQKQVNDKIADYEKQINDLKDKAVSKEDKDKLYNLYIALEMEYRLAGRLLDSKNASLDATKIDSQKAEAWAELFQVENERTDYKSALEDMQKALQYNPTNAQYWRTYIQFTGGQLKYSNEQMNQIYNDAIDKTADKGDIVVLYAQFLEKIGDNAGAISQWQQAETYNPEQKKQYEQEIARIRAK